MLSKTRVLGAVVVLAGICAILALALPAGATTTRAATSSGALESHVMLGVADETPTTTTTTTSDVGGDYGQQKPKTVKGKLTSAKLSKKSFPSSQARKVKLTCKFSPKSKIFRYVLSIKKGKKWAVVKSVKKTGSFKTYTSTVKKLFAGKAVKRGSYRLKLSADANSKVLTFKVT